METRITIQATGRGKFTARLGAIVLCEKASQPETTAARALVAMGITGRAEAWHEGASHASMSFDIERLAGLTVTEEPRPRFTKWRPFSGLGGAHE